MSQTFHHYMQSNMQRRTYMLACLLAIKLAMVKMALRICLCMTKTKVYGMYDTNLQVLAVCSFG